MKKKISLKDIAQKVGVSTALVSYVLNNQKLDRISKAVAKKIRDTARELDYRTNQIARSLKTSKTNTIGLIVADISNPFSSSIARLIEDEADKHGYTVLYGSSDENAERSNKLVNIFVNQQVDGLIIAPTEHTEAQLVYLKKNDIPFVLIDRNFPGQDMNYVGIDNYGAAYKLTQHLIDQQRKRISIISFTSTLQNLADRKKGYLECLRANGRTADNALIKEVGLLFQKEQVEQAMQQLLNLPEPMDGILFTSNTISLYALKYLTTVNIRVPTDLAVVAFDETDAADMFYAPVTHIKQPLPQMAGIAISTLMKNIAGNVAAIEVQLQGEMIVRKSSVE